METITTDFGPLGGVEYTDTYDDGRPRFVILARPNTIRSPAGDLVPQYTDEDLRRPRVEAVAFHENGMLKSVPLQQRTPVQTPAGELAAELLTFYPSGAVRRVFPLAGKLSGHWSWQDEARLADPLTIRTPAGPLTARFISILFHASGALRSLTLWPEETVTVASPVGPVQARVGLAFHAGGALRSLEPATPLAVETPIGPLTAYDNDPEGICGDVNSLSFSADGRLESLSTMSERIAVSCPDGRTRTFGPLMRINPCDGEATELTPLQIRFGPDTVAFGPDFGESFDVAGCRFQVQAVRPRLFDMSYACTKA